MIKRSRCEYGRGAGETLACGTGACASAYASYLNKKTGKKVLVHLLGGDLQIEYDDKKRYDLYDRTSNNSV